MTIELVSTVYTMFDQGNGTWKTTEPPPNQAPIVSNAIPNQSATENSLFTFQFASNSFSDPDGDTLTYSATLSSGAALPAWLTFTSGTRTFTGTPLNANIGAITVRVTASDGDLSAYDDFTLTVAASGIETWEFTGSGFGTKSSTAYFDDFESRALGAIGTTLGSLQTPGNSGFAIQNTNSYSGAKALTASNYAGNPSPHPYMPLSGTATRFYGSCRTYLTVGTAESGKVYKMPRIGAGTPYDGVPRAGESWVSGADGMPGSFGGEIVTSAGITSWGAQNTAGSNVGAYNADEWQFLEFEFYTGTVDVSDCVMRCWVSGTPVVSWVNRPFLTTANSELPDWWLIPYMGITGNPANTVTWDEFYFDESNARIVITDNATYASSTKWANQPVVAWADTTITSQKRYTGFTVGETVHVHLWKADGTYSYQGTRTV